uniref:Translocator protein n=1 Tax=Jaculus jaculus TaxID=51337 RepID=A0A8C5L5C4_JACJA
MAPPWVPAVGFTLAPSLGGFVGAYFVRGEGLHWYASLQKPSWHPPRWALAPVWGTLYSAMALADLLLISGAATATTVAWHRVSPPAARLLYPYLAWLAFATVLNYHVWRNNHGRPGGRRPPE